MKAAVLGLIVIILFSGCVNPFTPSEYEKAIERCNKGGWTWIVPEDGFYSEGFCEKIIQKEELDVEEKRVCNEHFVENWSDFKSFSVMKTAMLCDGFKEVLVDGNRWHANTSEVYHLVFVYSLDYRVSGYGVCAGNTLEEAIERCKNMLDDALQERARERDWYQTECEKVGDCYE